MDGRVPNAGQSNANGSDRRYRYIYEMWGAVSGGDELRPRPPRKAEGMMWGEGQGRAGWGTHSDTAIPQLRRTHVQA